MWNTKLISNYILDLTRMYTILWAGGNGGGGKVLNWTERLGVVTSIAKAVHFLHTGMIPGFFNNRLKSNNILLDHHFMPKLTDYGFSILSTDTSGVYIYL